MNELLDALRARLRNPLLGYFILAAMAVNWRVLFFLVVDSGTADSRIEYFNEHTTTTTLVLWPGLFALAAIIVSPWISYGVSFVAAKPLGLLGLLNAHSEHELLIAKKALEDARSGLLASKEDELIGRAKRDQEVAALEDEKLRVRLRAELDQLRTERETARNTSSASSPLFERHRELMGIAKTYRERANDSRTSAEDEHFRQMALEAEEEAHKLLGLPSRRKGEVQLSFEAATLLSAAAPEDGSIAYRNYIGGSALYAGGQNLLDDDSPRAKAKWEAAIRELEANGLIKDMNGKGEMFQLTQAGYDAVEKPSES